ncbi:MULTISPECIES: hypothetical protein [unclassified Microcoleus]
MIPDAIELWWTKGRSHFVDGTFKCYHKSYKVSRISGLAQLG